MRRAAWLLLAAILLVAALAGAAYLALDAWLESSGGRRAIERVLSEQSGYPVSLAGDFEVVLLPAPGVAGTDLRVSDGPGGERLLSGGRYGVSLALRPLLRRELNVDELTVGDIRFGAEEGADASFEIRELSIRGFQPGLPADFSLDLGAYGEALGRFTWRPDAGTLGLDVDWGGFLFPRLAVSLEIAYGEAGLWFDAIEAEVDGQALAGSGCYRFEPGGGLNLDLHAAMLDLDALSLDLPEGGEGEESFPLRLRLGADRVVRGDTVAEGVVFHFGDDPDCTAPAP